MTTESQAEPRNQRATITLTPSEKDCIRLVSIFDKTDESTLIRDQTIAQIVARADEIRKRVEAA